MPYKNTPYRRQAAVESEADQGAVGADYADYDGYYDDSGSGDDYWNDFMQSINVNNGKK